MDKVATVVILLELGHIGLTLVLSLVISIMELVANHTLYLLVIITLKENMDLAHHKLLPLPPVPINVLLDSLELIKVH